jgi:hypothetical protein
MDKTVWAVADAGHEYGDNERTEQAHPGIGAHGRPKRGDHSGAPKSYLPCQPGKVERFTMIEQIRDDVTVGELCRALDVSESGYYAWRETQTSPHNQRDAELSQQIQTVFDNSRHTFGSNRVEAALRK